MQQMTPLKRLWNLIITDRSDVIAIYFYAILSGLVQLSLPLGIQSIVGFVLGASLVTSVYVLIFLVVSGVAAVGIMQINQMKIIEKIQQKIFTRYALEFADTIPRFDLVKTDEYYLPEKVNRFFDTLSVQKGFSKLLLEVPIASIQIVFGLLLLGLYHQAFIIFGVAMLLVLWAIFRFTGNNGLTSSLTESIHKFKTVAWLQEMARVITPFKISHGTNLNLHRTDENVTNYLNARTAHFKVLKVQYRSLVVFKVFITAAMLIIGTVLLLEQQLNIGTFVAAEIVILTVISAVEKLIINLENVYDVATGLVKIATVTENLDETNGKNALHDQRIGFDLVNFSFGFNNDKQIFNNINLSITAGSLAWVSTKKGTGKSVFLKVLGGFYKSFEGTFLINKIPFNNYQLQDYRSKVGMYLGKQDVFIGTVWENIIMGREHITLQEITETAEKAGISDFLETLPEGFDTMVDPNGKNLTSRHRRNILLLRALLNQPKLLLLEDPWEGMEPQSKSKMIQYLASKPNNATVIIATNDDAIKNLCDYQIELTHGTLTSIKNN
mgnify:CR=1 FL=1